MIPTLRRLLSSALGACLLLSLMSVALVATHTAHNTELSAQDEYVYLDYLSKFPTQGFVRTGEETGEVARSEIACRGISGYGLYGDTCGAADFDSDALYPYNGQTGADIYTPLYFAVTWAAAQPLTATGLSLLEAGRAVGALWLALGVCLLFGALRALRVPHGVSLGLALAVIATPAMHWSTTYISTDAPTLAVTAGLLFAGVAIVQRRMSAWWLPLLAVVAVLFKVQNLAMVGLVAAVVVIERIVTSARERAPGFWRRLVRDSAVWSSVSSVLLVMVAQAVWLGLRAAEAVPGVVPPIIDNVQLQLSTRGVATEAFRFIWSIGTSGVSPNLIGIAIANALTALVVAALVGVLLRPRLSSTVVVILSAVTLTIALAMGPALALATSVVVGYYVPLPARYGIVLLPAFVACVGLFLHSYGRRGSAVVAGIGLGVAALAVIT